MSENLLLDENRLVKALGLLESTLEKIILSSYKKGHEAGIADAQEELKLLKLENENLNNQINELTSQLEIHKQEREEITCEISNSIKQLDLLIAEKQK